MGDAATAEAAKPSTHYMDRVSDEQVFALVDDELQRQGYAPGGWTEEEKETWRKQIKPNTIGYYNSGIGPNAQNILYMIISLLESVFSGGMTAGKAFGESTLARDSFTVGQATMDLREALVSAGPRFAAVANRLSGQAPKGQELVADERSVYAQLETRIDSAGKITPSRDGQIYIPASGTLSLNHAELAGNLTQNDIGPAPRFESGVRDNYIT